MATQGLFMDPQAAADARLVQLSQMDPNQRLFLQAARGGQQLGQGVGSLFGQDVRDPAVIRATKMRELAAKYGVDTAEGLDKIAADLQATDPNMAMQVKAQADSIRMNTAKLKSEEALAQQRGREKAGADPFQQFIRAAIGKVTPESLKKYQETGDPADLQWTEKPETSKPTVIGVAENTKQPVYSDGTQQFIYVAGPKGETVKQPYFGGVDRTTANVKVSATAESKGRAAFTEKLGALDAQRVQAASDARDSALATLRSLDSLATLDDQGLISGSFATGRVGATNLLATLGLVGETDKKRLASSENYQKIAGDVILGTLGGKLGAGFSNEDRKFIQSLVPQLENSPSARRQLINFMSRKNQQIINEATRLENYARDNEGLKGYQYNIPFSGGGSKTSAMSADDLAKAAGGRIVNGKFVKD